MVAGRDTHHIAFLAEIVPVIGLPAVETLKQPACKGPVHPGFKQIPLAIVGAVSGAAVYLLCRQLKGAAVQQHRPSQVSVRASNASPARVSSSSPPSQALEPPARIPSSQTLTIWKAVTRACSTEVS